MPALSPKLFPKGKTRLEGFENTILALYARGMTTRDIQSTIKDLYNGAEISHSVIANVTDAVIDEVTMWQSRPLEAIYEPAQLARGKISSNKKRKGACIYPACLWTIFALALMEFALFAPYQSVVIISDLVTLRLSK